MSATAQVNERLAALTAGGTSVWLDQIRRSLIEGGELQRLIDEDCLRGVTSNPSIFEKAILGCNDYDDQLAAMARDGLDAGEIYDRIAVRDVQLAADVLRSVWEDAAHVDGYVSLEVAPGLARDTDGTLEQARTYWQRLDRPNALIKIPGTAEGVPAIEQAIYEGINVNVTLLFAVSAYAEVAEAFIRGLERRYAEGLSLDVHSVASFFVSRVDTEVDKRLEALGGHDELRGTAALANARAAYAHFKSTFEGERFAALRAAGAPVQRPLWASTGTKNPRYTDTKYVDELVAPHTVNTMPLPTLLAEAEHGSPRPGSAVDDPTAALAALAAAGIDMDDVTATLLDGGIEQFKQAMAALIAGVEARREAVVTGRPAAIEASIPPALEPAIAARVARAVDEQVAARIWRHDETLWGGPGPEIGNRLGWLTISETMLEHAGELRTFVERVKADGFTDAALLGMGGSSLGPEVIRRSFGDIEGALRLHVLDSTDPDAIAELQARLPIEQTLFIVSSKSGGTVETHSQFLHFHALVAAAVGAERAGSHFVAVTDPGSPLVELAHGNSFRQVFENDPNIGGRYSVLSYFGLVPAALMGVAVEAMLHRCQVAEQNCTSYDSSASNSGLWLGLLMGELALAGRDKLTFIVSEPIASFGLWVEQLIAESTGKQGRGVLPVAGEPVGEPPDYGEDRVFAYLRNAEQPDAGLDAKVKALADAGHPTVTLAVHGAADLGRIFFYSEFATAVAGWVLEINPFNQPNVQEAKDNTAKVLDGYRSSGSLPAVEQADDGALRALLADGGPPHYVAIMGYLPPSPEIDAAVDDLRAAIRRATKATTTYGYGPRFLHSTGQFHKGGPPLGRFLQLVHEPGGDVEIPGAGYGFATLFGAQSAGDLQTLRAHGLPAERVVLSGDLAGAVRGLTKRIEGLLG
jgi:transaldolase/glucose-6-phosphate isomerase